MPGAWCMTRMGSMIAWLSAILAAGLPFTALAQDHGGGDAPPRCPPADASPPPAPPRMPPGGELLRGEVTLIITLDRCGKATAIEVEKSSGDARLDQAAVTAAWTWKLPPAQGDLGPQAGKVRVPVKFDPDVGGPNPKPTSRSRPRDAYFVERRAMQAAPPVLDADGKVPGYVADALPIGIDGIEQGLAMLERFGEPRSGPDANVKRYDILDEEGISSWYVIDEPSGDGKAIFRQRAVSDGTRGFWVTSDLCAPTGSAMCTRFRDYLESFDPQPDMPPPPLPPPPKPDSD